MHPDEEEAEAGQQVTVLVVLVLIAIFALLFAFGVFAAAMWVVASLAFGSGKR